MPDIMGRILPKIFCTRVMEKLDGAIGCSTGNAGRIIGIGGTVQYDGDYTVHTFTADDTFEIIQGSGDVEILVVAGGGAGGGCSGTSISAAGGGGGGVIAVTDPMTLGTFPVVVGAGGTGTNDRGNNGQDSTFNGHTAIGGGGGGSIVGTRSGAAGGSGGGAGSDAGGTGFTYFGGAGTPGQGYAGGDGGAGGKGGAGGGGASSVGANGTLAGGGDGGTGLSSDITGNTVTYGGGGGGAIPVNAFGSIPGTTAGNGTHGGANGSAIGGSGEDAVDGRGGGGGGTTGANVGGDGGDGVVIVRYLGVGIGGAPLPTDYHGPIPFTGCTRSQTVDGVGILIDCNSQNNTGIFPDYLEYECLGDNTVRSARNTDGILVFRFDEPVTSVLLTRLANPDWNSGKGKPQFAFCTEYQVILDPNGPPANGSRDGQIVGLKGSSIPAQDMTQDEVLVVTYSPGFNTLVIFEQTTTPSSFKDVYFKTLA